MFYISRPVKAAQGALRAALTAGKYKYFPALDKRRCLYNAFLERLR